MFLVLHSGKYENRAFAWIDKCDFASSVNQMNFAYMCDSQQEAIGYSIAQITKYLSPENSLKFKLEMEKEVPLFVLRYFLGKRLVHFVTVGRIHRGEKRRLRS